MEENNFNNNPINNELPQQPIEPVASVQSETVQPVVEPVTQEVQQPVVEPVQPTISELQQPVEPVATVQEPVVQPEPVVTEVQQPVEPVAPQVEVGNTPSPEKKGGNKTVVLAILALILLAVAVVAVLFATGKLDFGKKEEPVVQEEKKPELSYKSVYNVNLEKKSNAKLGSISVIITQSEKTYNGDVVGLQATSVKVNDKELIDKVNMGGIDSYTIFNKYVIFLSSNTSGSLLSIYNTETDSVESYDPKNLFGYGVGSYYVEDNKIVIMGRNQAQQYGMADTGYKNAEIEIAFSNGAFSEPKIVKESNKKAEYFNRYNINGDSQTTLNNINLNIKQVDDGTTGTPALNSVTANGKEIKDKLDNLAIKSYSIVDNYVIFMLYSTSHTELRIYDSNTDSIVSTINANTLGGYMIRDYSFVEDFIIIDGKNASQQVGEADPGYDYAHFRINYTENKFSTPTKINEFNESDIIK